MTEFERLQADASAQHAHACEYMRRRVFDAMTHKYARKFAAAIAAAMRRNDCDFAVGENADRLADYFAEAIADAFERPDPEGAYSAKRAECEERGGYVD